MAHTQRQHRNKADTESSFFFLFCFFFALLTQFVCVHSYEKHNKTVAVN